MNVGGFLSALAPPKLVVFVQLAIWVQLLIFLSIFHILYTNGGRNVWKTKPLYFIGKKYHHYVTATAK